MCSSAIHLLKAPFTPDAEMCFCGQFASYGARPHDEHYMTNAPMMDCDQII